MIQKQKLNHREIQFDYILTTLGTQTNNQHDQQGYKAPLSIIRMDDCILSQPGGQGGGMTLSSVEEAFQGMSNALAQVLAQLRQSHFKTKCTKRVLQITGIYVYVLHQHFVLHICDPLCLTMIFQYFRKQTRKPFCGRLKVANMSI